MGSSIKMREKINPLINVTLYSISLMALFLPFFNIETFDVYMYDLSRTQIARKEINYFELIFGNYFFEGKWQMILYMLLIIALIAINLIIFKINNKKLKNFFTIALLLLLIIGVSFFSFSNSLFAKVVGGKTYMYQSAFLQISKSIAPIEPKDTSHDISYWINEGIGCYLIIILLSISFFITFYNSFIIESNKRIGCFL